MAAHGSPSESLFPTTSEPAPSDPGDYVIRMEGVTVRRGDTTLLDSVDWTVELDERWVVLGPNGAGKTTLLNLISGLDRPDAGEIRLEGEVTTGSSPNRLAALGMRHPE